MAYQALYRVFRPKTFSDMVGQDMIVQTLQNAIDQKQTAHAYLFSGPRGTGKTSAAKIFARTVNGIDPNTPDDQAPDIIEIDAASNNGVDEMRNIRDSANYAPISAPFKIYIIDEAHMLTTQAFNALLKTLEEPPARVKFILATTEPQKIPATVLSRMQRFDFKRIDSTVIQKRLQMILDDKQITYEADALRIIANVAEGGMRDALSLLDQVIAYATDVTTSSALAVTGSASVEQLTAYLADISENNVANALIVLQDILSTGKSAKRFISDLVSILRDVMLASLAPNLIRMPISLEQLQVFGKKWQIDELKQMMLLFQSTEKQLQNATQSDVYLELLTVQLALIGAKQSRSITQNSDEKDQTNQITPDNLEPAVQKNDDSAMVISSSEKSQPELVAKSEITPQRDATVVPEKVPVHGGEVQNNIDLGLETAVNANNQNSVIFPNDELNNSDASQLVETTKAQSQLDEAQTTNTKAPEIEPKALVWTGKKATFAVLAQATKKGKEEFQHNFLDILQDLGAETRTILEASEPVAVGPTAVLLAVQYENFLPMILNNLEIQHDLIDLLTDVQLPDQVVLITQDDWNSYRTDYIAELKSGNSHSDQLDALPTYQLTPKVPTQPELKEPEIIQSAKNNFGAEIVEVIED